MIRFSANLGFLWREHDLIAAIHAAAAAGFDAVECHWPFDVPPASVKSALAVTGLPMVSLNTRAGDTFGLAALPEQMDKARAAIDEALDYAHAVGSSNVHVMAGNASGEVAHRTFVDNLRQASARAAANNITLLIEPMNAVDAPHYFLRAGDQARAIIEEVGAPNLKLMFDCYHFGRSGEDVEQALARLFPVIGHIQFAAVPHRGPPDHGDVEYSSVLRRSMLLGYQGYWGAEYQPAGPTDGSLSWMEPLRRS